MIQIIKRGLQKRIEARRNRVWVVLIDENGPLMLSPAYFKNYHPEEDQLRERRPIKALSRLSTCLGLQEPLHLSYLHKFALNGGYLYVFYVLVPMEEKIPSILNDYMSKLRMDVPQQREVALFLDEALAGDSLYTMRRLQADGVISS
jgi:hypothetical protein